MKPIIGERRGQRPASQPRSDAEEPRTGVVRKVTLDPDFVARRVRASTDPGHAASRQTDRRQPGVEAPRRASTSQVVARGQGAVFAGEEDAGTDPDGTWRCLQWADRPSQRAPRRDVGVSVVQMSMSGKLLRQRGDQEWLPGTSDFVHRLALRVAQGLGFERCQAVCLRGAKSVLSVSEAGPTTIVAVSGPSRALGSVLRRMGLE